MAPGGGGGFCRVERGKMPRQTGVYKDVSYTVIARETPRGEWKWELNFTIQKGGKSWVRRKFHPYGAAYPTVFSALEDGHRQAGALIEHELQ